MKPKVVVAPDFRRMDEIFDPPALARLHDVVDVEWGRDGPMPHEASIAKPLCVKWLFWGAWSGPGVPAGVALGVARGG